ncbi:MAG: uroporphyrinogen decarboxylase family protein [bacterium]
MKPSERLEAVVTKRRPDRVQVATFVRGYAARLCGFSLKTFYTDMEVCVKAQILAQELHGYDQSPSFGWVDWGGWEFGGGVRFPESDEEGAPRTLMHPVERPSDLERLDSFSCQHLQPSETVFLGQRSYSSGAPGGR